MLRNRFRWNIVIACLASDKEAFVNGTDIDKHEEAFFSGAQAKANRA